MTMASPSKTRTSQIRVACSRGRPAVARAEDADDDDDDDDGGMDECADGDCEGKEGEEEEEQLLRKNIVRMMGSKISSGNKARPPSSNLPKRWECNFGNLASRRLITRLYVLCMPALSPVRKARGRGRLRKLAREVKAWLGVWRVRRRSAAES